MSPDEIIALQNKLVDGLKKNEKLRASLTDPMAAFSKGYRQGFEDAKNVYDLKTKVERKYGTDWK